MARRRFPSGAAMNRPWTDPLWWALIGLSIGALLSR